MEIENYLRLGLDQMWDEARVGRVANGRSNAELFKALATDGDRIYHPCAQAYRRDEIPRGSVEHIEDWRETEVFAGTTRHVTTYVPHGLDADQPAPLMVFNDGLGYLDEAGSVRAAAVLDTLVHRGELPAMVAVFVMPGRPAHLEAPDPSDYSDPRRVPVSAQRCFEYDSVTDAYPKFLVEELLPDLEVRLGVRFIDEPSQRAIAGISSGGICAFNAAWHRPESFGLVLSHCGSFVNIRGGHHYPYLIRSTDRKPIRVFLTSGESDGDIVTGNWPLANRQIASALEFAGYEVRFEFGTGGHSLRHGGALLADSLRWLWQT